MDRGAPSKETAFNKLPIEMNKEIAHYLYDHKDIANFKAICKKTSQAIDGDFFSFWRAKFCDDFARPPDKTNEQLCRLYRERWALLRRFVTMKTAPQYQFVRGHTPREKAIVRILRDLINQSFAGHAQLEDGNRRHCLNMERLKEFVLESRLLLGGRRPPPPKANEDPTVDVSLAAIRVMATHFLFDQALQPGNWFAIDDAQKAVYAATNEAPLYGGPYKNILNMEWVLQCVNFFRYYMSGPLASDLHDTMQDLDESQKPSAWEEPLKSGSYPLGSHWKGTYAFLEHNDLRRFRKLAREGKHAQQIFTDLYVDEGKIQVGNAYPAVVSGANHLGWFQSLYLDFDSGAEAWPDVFEDRLHSLRETIPAQARAQRSKKSAPLTNIRFSGHGEDLDDLFHANGYLNPLPAQAGISGWQRVTFMKHFEEDLAIVDNDNLWAYEGVVLPGGRIILGRWWYASDDDIDFNDEYGGPFILWAVEPEEVEFEEGEED